MINFTFVLVVVPFTVRRRCFSIPDLFLFFGKVLVFYFLPFLNEFPTNSYRKVDFFKIYFNFVMSFHFVTISPSELFFFFFIFHTLIWMLKTTKNGNNINSGYVAVQIVGISFTTYCFQLFIHRFNIKQNPKSSISFVHVYNI